MTELVGRFAPLAAIGEVVDAQVHRAGVEVGEHAAGLDGAKVFATLTLVDVTGSTICGEASFEAHE